MVEITSPVSSAGDACKDTCPVGGGAAKSSSYRVEEDARGEMIKCSGKYCRSCTASLIADCVAICCCPCGVVNMLALALVKVPWTLGRRCLLLLRNKGRRNSGAGISKIQQNIDHTIIGTCNSTTEQGGSAVHGNVAQVPNSDNKKW